MLVKVLCQKYLPFYKVGTLGIATNYGQLGTCHTQERAKPLRTAFQKHTKNPILFYYKFHAVQDTMTLQIFLLSLHVVVVGLCSKRKNFINTAPAGLLVLVLWQLIEKSACCSVQPPLCFSLNHYWL